MSAQNLRGWRMVPGLVIIASLLLSGAAVAGAPEAGPILPTTDPLNPAAPAGADDSYWDVGAEYPSADAPPWGASAEDRPVHRDSAWNFYNKMRAAGYTGSHSFIYGNDLAWETDYKRAALGGSENSWVDNVDIFFVHSHGNYNNTTGVGSIWIPWNHTDTSVVPNDCWWSWGDKDVEWIGIKTCLSLKDLGWGSCMNGVHIIAGFTTLSASVEFGGYWADQMLGLQWPFGWLREPKTVSQAWFTTCDARTSGAKARVLAEDWRHFNDKVWGRGGPAYGDVVDNVFYVQDHNCYKPPARQLDADVFSGAEVQTYVVDPRNVDQAYAQGIANALGLQGEVQCPAGSTECGLVASVGGQTLTLSIETATGGFVLQNLDQLWAGQDPEEPLTLPTEEDAVSLAASFLDSHQALPGSSNVNTAEPHYLVDTQGQVVRPSPGTAVAASPQIVDTQGVDVLVAYGRVLPTGVRAADGSMIEGSTVGPGSATKIYYGAGGSAALRTPDGQQLPIGLTAGTRDVTEGPLITTMSDDKAWEAFVADPQLALLSIPLEWDNAVRRDQTFSPGYEQPLNVPQAALIPVWVFTADLYKGNELVGPDATIHVPASTDYYPPSVTIDEPADGSTILAGKWIDLKATASGGYQPFTYEWSSTAQGPLGNQEDIKAFLLAGPDKPEQAGPSPVIVSLTVTNGNGQSRTAEVVVNVVGRPTWLPLIRR